MVSARVRPTLCALPWASHAVFPAPLCFTPPHITRAPHCPSGTPLHESRSPYSACRYADPVSLSRIGCPPRFNRCSLAQRGVDYIYMAHQRALQLTRSISGEERGRWGEWGWGVGGGVRVWEEMGGRGESLSARYASKKVSHGCLNLPLTPVSASFHGEGPRDCC